MTTSAPQTAYASLNTTRVVGARLLRGIGANVYGQVVSLTIQFGSTPLLLSAWGSQTFGLWLMISAIPAYFALADVGFSAAAANDMTLAAARGARGQACETFQSLLAFHALVALTLIVGGDVGILLIPDRFLPNAAGIGGNEIRLVWTLQTLQVAATLGCGALVGGFQASGRYPLGIVLANSARLGESLALTVGAVLLHGFAGAATLMVAARLIGLIAMAVVLSLSAPWLPLGFRHARAANLRRLARPALAVAALPISFALSLQGFVLVIGATLSLEAVAMFSAVRTLTRATVQIAGILNHAIMPEVTRAFGAGDKPRVRPPHADQPNLCRRAQPCGVCSPGDCRKLLGLPLDARPDQPGQDPGDRPRRRGVAA